MPIQDQVLSLPWQISGLLRIGTPMINTTTGLRGVIFSLGIELMVFDVGGGLTPLYSARGYPSAPEWEVDLSSATGRAHATWYVADWRRGWSGIGAILLNTNRGEWIVKDERDNWTYFAADAEPRRSNYNLVVVPGLARLVVDDVNLLPDRSRWVDALAIQHIVLHVAELQKQTAPSSIVEPPSRPTPSKKTCNRHLDCEYADERAREKGLMSAVHCSDDCCEDCFGR